MKYLLTIIILFAILISCTNDDHELEKVSIDPIKNDTIAVDTVNVDIIASTDQEFAAKNFGSQQTSSFIGKITDIDGTSLEKVKITIGDQTALTDVNGVFSLSEVAVHEKFAFIKAEKATYILGSRTIVPSSNGSNVANITLLKRNSIETINTGKASEVSLPNGAKVNFAGSFIDASGAEYSGKVEVSIHYLEPNQTTTFSQMPGSLFGKRENNEPSAMETYGMLAINLYSPAGEVLNISEDTPAVLHFPVSTTTPNAPSTIPLWYFDETVGYWKEQGVATTIDGMYVAEVTHFTWWNCDLPLNSIRACFELKKDVILPNTRFKITTSSDDQLIYTGTTDEQGLNCGLFPKNEKLTVTLFGDCDTEKTEASIEIGPFLEDSPSISINVTELADSAFTTLVSTVTNCNNAPLTNGYALLYSTNNSDDSKILPIRNGEIEQQLVYCKEGNYSMVVIDLDTNEVSDETTLTIIENGITNLGQLQTCPGEASSVFEGSITLTTQEELDAFGAFGYSEITGDIKLEGKEHIFSLESLATLTAIGGNLYIKSGVQNLIGLEKLETIGGDFSLLQNSNLTSLAALENLTSVGGLLWIDINKNLTTLTGLESLTSAGSIIINSNQNLTALTGLENLTTIDENLYVTNHLNLTNLQGLQNITSVGLDLTIQDNDKLTTIEGLESLNSVGRNFRINGNPLLTTLTGLENLNSIGDILFIGTSFRPNSSLSNFCALTNLITNGTHGDVRISDNQYNPTYNDLYNGDCEEHAQSGGIYEGSITLTTQAEVENFGTIGYTEVTGDVIIEDSATPTITSLANLDYLTKIGGSLTISKTAITNLQGLQNLTSIGNRLTISNNNNLNVLTGLGNVTSIGGRYVTITNNSALTSLTGLENITEINGELRISYNSITSLAGLDNISSIELALIITQNRNLTSLSGLDNLTSIGHGLVLSGSAYNTVGLQIGANPELATFSGLDNVTAIKGDLEIRNNAKLISLEGLENITEIQGHLSISKNSQLTSVKGLNTITSVLYNVAIWNNSRLNSILDLENITSIGAALSLHENGITSLNGLEKLISVGDKIIIGASYDEDFNLIYGGNYSLTNFCGITNLIKNGTYTEVLIEENAYNPTTSDIYSGRCSQ
ncbi:hypothetical protein ZORO111903_13830 [Zobellia roscoffensis]|uniref:hypothetical protein n=1 Tax=Zobellia roscoffensis TaxID=2779508 RepID=UPI001889CFB9|nr:hypothetical protein [Zobellia roscoffensis]